MSTATKDRTGERVAWTPADGITRHGVVVAHVPPDRLGVFPEALIVRPDGAGQMDTLNIPPHRVEPAVPAWAVERAAEEAAAIHAALLPYADAERRTRLTAQARGA